MNISKPVFLLTTKGIYKTTTNFQGVFASTGIDGNFSVACLTNDVKTPYFWYGGSNMGYYNTKNNNSRKFVFVRNPRYIREIQNDQKTNKVFCLMPFTNESVYGNIFIYDPLTKEISIFNLTVGGVTTYLFYTLDIKIDSLRRKIWILDAGNKRILRANIDSGAVDAIFSPSEMIAPCSMAIDFSTGDAYIRCLNGSYEDTEIRETIYIAHDNGITSFIETQSFTTYNNSWLSPSLNDIQNIVLSGDGIPLPNSGTIKFDQIRNNLWWTSKSEERIVFMANVKSKVMRSISLQSSLDSIWNLDLDMDSGEAFVCGTKGATTKISLINNSCSAYVEHGRIISVVGEIKNIIIVQPKLQTVIPFYITSLANNINESSSISSDEDDIINLDSINNSLIAENEETGIITSSTPYVNIRVLGQEDLGVSTAIVWTAKDKASNENALIRSISTPKFSWSSQVFSYKPVFVVATTSGKLLKIEYDQSSNTILKTGECINPVSGEITGLSACNGDGNIYMSGNGKLAKINLDPTVPGEEDIASSLSESSSSSNSGAENLKQIFVSQLMGETEVGGLSVQNHSKSGPVYAISKQDGTLMSFYGINDWNNKQVYGPLPSPFKAIWSSQHSGVIVACKNSVHLVDVTNKSIETIYSTPAYNITDICVQNGNIGISVSSDGLDKGFFKVLSKDFSSNLLTYKTESEFPAKACFVSANTVLLSLQRIENNIDKTRFVSIELGGEPSNTSKDVVGTVSSMFVDLNFEIIFAAFDSGEIITLSPNGTDAPIAKKAGKVSDGIMWASGSLLSNLQDQNTSQPAPSADKPEYKQTKVRVFVGSVEGSNDRWDSGVIVTQSEEIAYGGGDNLEPGEAYWVTILIMKENNKWSEPISKQFIAPVM